MHIHLLYTYLNIIQSQLQYIQIIHLWASSHGVFPECAASSILARASRNSLARLIWFISINFDLGFVGCYLSSKLFQKVHFAHEFPVDFGLQKSPKGWPPEESSQWASDLWYMPLSTNSSAQLHSLSPKHIPTAGMEGNSSFSALQNPKRNKKNTWKVT